MKKGLMILSLVMAFVMAMSTASQAASLVYDFPEGNWNKYTKTYGETPDDTSQIATVIYGHSAISLSKVSEEKQAELAKKRGLVVAADLREKGFSQIELLPTGLEIGSRVVVLFRSSQLQKLDLAAIKAAGTAAEKAVREAEAAAIRADLSAGYAEEQADRAEREAGQAKAERKKAEKAADIATAALKEGPPEIVVHKYEPRQEEQRQGRPDLILHKEEGFLEAVGIDYSLPGLGGDHQFWNPQTLLGPEVTKDGRRGWDLTKLPLILEVGNRFNFYWKDGPYKGWNFGPWLNSSLIRTTSQRSRSGGEDRCFVVYPTRKGSDHVRYFEAPRGAKIVDRQPR
jgi:hypothetical protein